MTFGQRIMPAVGLWLASAGAAFAADEVVLQNAWALAVQRWLLHWGIWYTGIHRLDDGAFFGFVCCIVLVAFIVSAIGLILFKARGLNFTLGWIVGIPVCLGAMLLYCKLRPFPNYDDMSWLFLSAGAAQLVALTLCWFVKVAFASDDESEAKAASNRGGAPGFRTAAEKRSFRPEARAFAKSASSAASEAMRDRMKLAVRSALADKTRR